MKQMKVLENFEDKELIKLYQYRVRNIDDGLDETEYNKRIYDLTFGLEPEYFYIQKNKFEIK